MPSTIFWAEQAWRAFAAAALASAMLLSACAHAPPEGALALGPVCDFGAVRFDAEMDGGRLSSCRRTGADAYELYILPEDAPINPSPWFAFAVETAHARTLALTLRYDHGRHRYDPDISTDDGASWTELTPEIAEDARSARFTVETPAGRTLIAGDPLIPTSRYDAWLVELAARPGAELSEIGRSEEGRPIEAVRIGRLGAPAFVVLGRQHPPETQGALAMFAFVERMLEDDPLARRFGDVYAIAVAPNLNPDGVAAGHWRHNANGVDLNRDWGPFTQAETRAARDWLETLGPLAAAYDFHATWRDVLYTQPDDVAGARAELAGALHAALVEAFGEDAPGRDAAHNPAAPTSKGWIYETYRIPAVTYEVGDATPRAHAEAVARAAAEATMLVLLGGPHLEIAE